MVRRNQDLMELIRRKASMSAQVVSQIDKEYAWYVGSDTELAIKMAKIDFMLKSEIIPKPMIPFVKLMRKYLDQKRKAVLANLCTEITKLGFLLGERRVVEKATSE